MSYLPPMHSPFLYPQTLPSPLEWEVEWKHGNWTSSGMKTWQLACLPAHGPYFLRLIREMPNGARKKAQNPPNNCHMCFSIHFSRIPAPKIAATFLLTEVCMCGWVLWEGGRVVLQARSNLASYPGSLMCGRKWTWEQGQIILSPWDTVTSTSCDTIYKFICTSFR